MKLTIYNYICFFVFGYFFSYSSSCCAFVADDVNHRLEVLIARKSIMGRVVTGSYSVGKRYFEWCSDGFGRQICTDGC